MEDVARVDELVVGSGGTASELCVIHASDAFVNEEIGDGASEGVGDSLHDVEPDVVGDSPLDSRNGGT
jgi:hypothetical protein